MKKTSTVIFRGSFNPPGKHHQEIVRSLTEEFDRVIIVCNNRQDKDYAKFISNEDRIVMVKLAFGKIPRVKFDFYDLENNVYTSISSLKERYANKYSKVELWYAVGSDLIIANLKNQSFWENLKFCIIARPGYDLKVSDLPPKYKYISNEVWGNSTVIRERLAIGATVKSFVSVNVLNFILKHHLYGS